MGADESMKRSKLDLIYSDILGDVHELLKQVEGLKTHLPEAAQDFKNKLNPALKEFELTLGLIVDKSKLSEDRLLQTANALRAETIQIIEAAKHAASESATYTADIQGKHAVKGIEAKAKEAKISIEDFADELKKDIAENTEILTYKALEQPLGNLATQTEATVTILKVAIKALGDAKTQLEEANTAIKKSLLVSCVWLFGAAVLGGVLTLGTAHALGWIGHTNGLTQDEYSQMLTRQKFIYDRIQELKPPIKNTTGK